MIKVGDGIMFRKLGDRFRRFMYGRYGSDQLTMFLLIVGVVLAMLGSFTELYWLGFLSYVPLICSIFRMYSRNLYKRRAENERFLSLFKRLKDHQNRYFSCPRCRQKIRVPRGKGRIRITCPACGERFEKKT